MHHPELEQQLRELHQQKVKAAEDLRDLANEAVATADRSNKTLLLYLDPAGVKKGCECTGELCVCAAPKKRGNTSRLFKKVKKVIKNRELKDDVK